MCLGRLYSLYTCNILRPKTLTSAKNEKPFCGGKKGERHRRIPQPGWTDGNGCDVYGMNRIKVQYIQLCHTSFKYSVE